MAEYDSCIVGSTVVSSRGRSRLNIGIAGGKIAYVGPERPTARTTVDAAGLVALPGGVDTHVHLMDPGATEREDFPAGTRAAARAGVTTIVEHTHAEPVRTVEDLHAKVKYLDGRSHVDFGLAAHAWPGYTEHVPHLWAAGVAFFKVFTCTTHGVPGHTAAALVTHLRATSDIGAMSLIHCEDESMTAADEERLQEEMREDNGILSEWRSRDAEVVAASTAAILVRRTRASATIAHVSHPEVARYVTDERRRGADIAAEACPQYFLLRDDEALDHGGRRKFTPPARARHDHDEAEMWSLLRDETLTHVSSDHAPSTAEQKACGSIWDVPFGLPGLDTTFPALIDAVARGHLAWEDIARTYAEMPARRYGLWPRKGAIRVGFDADLALVDPSQVWQASEADIESKAGWTPYSGRTFQGRVVRTILRGATVAEHGTLDDERRGAWLPGPGTRRETTA
ncbi:MAG: amidohydrolase family protein [Propionibacteriales bacterium]|nr:amidohydrolase family protein [Propionibacteriales bacterium]